MHRKKNQQHHATKSDDVHQSKQTNQDCKYPLSTASLNYFIYLHKQLIHMYAMDTEYLAESLIKVINALNVVTRSLMFSTVPIELSLFLFFCEGWVRGGVGVQHSVVSDASFNFRSHVLPSSVIS